MWPNLNVWYKFVLFTCLATWIIFQKIALVVKAIVIGDEMNYNYIYLGDIAAGKRKYKKSMG